MIMNIHVSLVLLIDRTRSLHEGEDKLASENARERLTKVLSVEMYSVQ